MHNTQYCLKDASIKRNILRVFILLICFFLYVSMLIHQIPPSTQSLDWVLHEELLFKLKAFKLFSYYIILKSYLSDGYIRWFHLVLYSPPCESSKKHPHHKYCKCPCFPHQSCTFCEYGPLSRALSTQKTDKEPIKSTKTI